MKDEQAQVEDPAMAKAPLQEEPKEGEQKVEAQKEPEKKHEPEVESPRWKEVYGKMKSYERELEDSKKTSEESQKVLEELRAHNAKLSESMGVVEDQLETTTKPDREEDPEAYETWLVQKTIRQTIKAQQQQSQPEPEHLPQQQVPGLSNDQIQVMQAEIQRGIHSDYDAALADMQPQMDRDRELFDSIMRSANPAQMMYSEWSKQKDQREQNNEQGSLESSTYGKAEQGGKIQLSKEQERAADKLGIPRKDYLKQLEQLQNRSAI